ncbi:MAG: DUF4912 domain-containing protein [Spartobacteria bacterium]
MATNDSNRTGFRISDEPVARTAHEQENSGARSTSNTNAPLLFAIPRDPRTVFVYWNLDWAEVFERHKPLDRHVYLRVVTADGGQESESTVEPLLGSFYAPVKNAGGVYHVELGYYGEGGAWQSVGTSDVVTMPAEAVSQNTAVDVATVPFHLSFQKMIDLLSESNGDPLAIALSRAQNRAVENEDVDLAPQDREAMRALDLSVDRSRAERESLADRPNEEALRKRAEAILGFGSTSPARGFGGSSHG